MVITTEDNIHNLQYKTKSTDVHMVPLKGNLIPARGWRAGQPRLKQQNLSKRARVPANIPNHDGQHSLGTRNREPVVPV